MSKSYLNKVELKDGQVILFHRPNAKRPIYQMRIHVRGMTDVFGNKVTYVQEPSERRAIFAAFGFVADFSARIERVRGVARVFSPGSGPPCGAMA